MNDHLQTEDANDILYAVDASHDYDPGPALEKIEAPLLAINSADDLVNSHTYAVLWKRDLEELLKSPER